MNLDEYVGFVVNDLNSYYYYMNELLFFKKVFKESFLFNGEVMDVEVECVCYEEILFEYLIDI